MLDNILNDEILLEPSYTTPLNLSNLFLKCRFEAEISDTEHDKLTNK